MISPGSFVSLLKLSAEPTPWISPGTDIIQSIFVILMELPAEPTALIPLGTEN